MPGRPVTARLDAPTHVFVVLRLTVDRQGQFKYGEVVDGTAQSWGRYNSWCGMIRGVRSYLASLAQDADANRT